MRRIFIILYLFLFIHLHLDAATVTPEEAQLLCSEWLKSSIMSGDPVISDMEVLSCAESEIGYVFSLEPHGFVIFSADCCLPAVIYYSTTADWGNTGFYAEKFREFITHDIRMRLDNISAISGQELAAREAYWEQLFSGNFRNTTARDFTQWPPEGTTPTGGWLWENWHQNSPFNAMCPMDPITNLRSLAGCPAVAMASVLNYHETINEVGFSDEDDYFHNYAGRQYWIDDDHAELDFPSFAELNAYLAELSYHYNNDISLTDNDRAALTFACGVAATQVYTSGGSGTFGVSQAYQAYQKFNFTNSVLYTGYSSELENAMIANIMEALPVHFAIVNPSWTAGHNLVVDGYNTDGYFHLNFGWNGSYNGWYLIPDEIPYGLTVIEGAITDITTAITSIYPHVLKADWELNNYPNPFNPSTTISFYNRGGEDIRIRIYNISGQLVRTLFLDAAAITNEEVFWDGRLSNGAAAASGLYMYLIESSSWKSPAEKMLLIK
ncbi:MAG: C10 family peptidase [Candidatus Cloacimonetes bacterium]|nr:C10 family peptidase [Candidatus Cloacimonadota bacterium]